MRVRFLQPTEGVPEGHHQAPAVVAAVAAADILVAAAAVEAADILVAAADILEAVGAATARVAAWEATPQQPVRAAPHWGATARLWRIVAPRVPVSMLPARFPAHMPWANMRQQSLPAQVNITTALFAVSPCTTTAMNTRTRKLLYLATCPCNG